MMPLSWMGNVIHVTTTTTTACAPAHCDTLSDTIGYNFQSFERLVTNSSTVYSQSYHDETQPHSQFSLESQIEPNYEANEGIIFLGCLTKAIKPSTRSTHFLLGYANSLDFRSPLPYLPVASSVHMQSTLLVISYQDDTLRIEKMCYLINAKEAHSGKSKVIMLSTSHII
ncbi:uncharacterized protein RAG0_01575 [Rhynchosporium agropyri]|uniref:Uncharacterized protein n=1 Tax=Rhynchosporium agropyri TaxID=914238 RepID=A0A1E1JXE0_9HELO|nr:uncharacterized protein RAG0_01575 [Rhynchosporium agropyri]